MNIFILIASILFFYGNSTIRASLKIAKYDPLSFQLTFSQNITLPSFQLLVDNKNLPYNVLTNDTHSSVYEIEVTSNYQDIDTQNTQAFSLIFNYPLDIGNGQLYINNYVLSPPKTDLFIAIGTWPVYLIFASLYVCSSVSIISLAVIDFIQIYVLTGMKFHNKTSSLQAYRSLFFFDHTQNVSPQDYLLKLIRPTIILVCFFILGLIAKFLARFIKNPFVKRRIIKLIAYDIFLSVWTIQLPSIIYKAFQFMYDIFNKRLNLTNGQYAAGIVITHLNFVNFLTYFYVLYFIINPLVNQNSNSFRKYLLSPQFQLYTKFHRGLHLSDFIKRNTIFFLCLRKLLVVILYFFVDNIAPYVLGLQLIGSFFIFTVRPYKQWYYTNVFILFNLIWFFFYIMVLEGFFYFNISNFLETRFSLTKYLLSRSIIFHIIGFIGIIASVIEAYRLFKNLKYEFKEDKQVKIHQSPVITTRGRLYTQTSDKMNNDMKQSLIFDSSSSPQKTRKKRQPSNSSNEKGKINLFEIQMEQFSPAIVNRKLSTQIKKKWKDKSLLQQLATN